MGKSTTSKSWRMIINILLLILGIIFIAEPARSLEGVAIALGILLVIYGGLMIALNEVHKARGQAHDAIIWPIVWLVLGILLLVFAHRVAGWLLPLIAGVWMILLGITNLRAARKLGGATKADAVGFILAVAEIILGILCVCSMATGGTALGIMIGVCMLIYGVCSIISWAVNYVGAKRA